MATPQPFFDQPYYLVQDAGFYCRARGKEVTISNMLYKKVIFTCLSSADSEYSRPSYQSAPTVIIQDGR